MKIKIIAFIIFILVVIIFTFYSRSIEQLTQSPPSQLRDDAVKTYLPQINQADILKPEQHYKPKSSSLTLEAFKAQRRIEDRRPPPPAVLAVLQNLPAIMQASMTSIDKAHLGLKKLRVCILHEESSFKHKQICLLSANQLVRRYPPLRPELDIMLPALPPQLIHTIRR